MSGDQNCRNSTFLLEVPFSHTVDSSWIKIVIYLNEFLNPIRLAASFSIGLAWEQLLSYVSKRLAPRAPKESGMARWHDRDPSGEAARC